MQSMTDINSVYRVSFLNLWPTTWVSILFKQEPSYSISEKVGVIEGEKNYYPKRAK